VIKILKNYSVQFKTSAFLISNTAEGGRSDFLLKNSGSGYNNEKLEHASQDFSIIDLKYCWKRKV
jgi:hypothetical protein